MGHEMTAAEVTLWKLANNTLRGLSRQEVSVGSKIVGSRIWAAWTAGGLASGILTPQQISELTVILR